MKAVKNFALVLGIFMFAVPAFAQVADDYGTTDSGSYCPKLSITMQRGARDVSYGGQVSELQKFLSDYYDIDPEEIVTGFFGRITQGYVKQFQKERGLPTFGIAGSMTRAAIVKICTTNTFNNQTSSNTQTTPKNCPVTVTPACIGQAILGTDGCMVGWQCKAGTITIPNQEATEQVKCVFNGATTEQKCYGYAPSPTIGSNPIYYSCSGIGTCVVTVTGKQNTPVTWGSSCGGSANTTIDNNNEYANFTCPTTIQPSITVTYPNGWEGFTLGKTIPITWKTSQPGVGSVSIYLRDEDNGKEFVLEDSAP